MAQYMRPEALNAKRKKNEVQICKKCMTEARNVKGSLEYRHANPCMPTYSPNNMVDFDEVSLYLRTGRAVLGIQDRRARLGNPGLDNQYN